MAKINEEVGKVGFGRAIANFFKGYVDFTGKSTRASYWWIQLFLLIVFLPLLLLWGIVQMLIMGNFVSPLFMASRPVVSPIVVFNPILFLIILGVLAILIPGYALLARRFRDVGISNAWIFIVLVVSFILAAVSLFLHKNAQPDSWTYALKFFIFMMNFGLGVAFFIFSLLPSGYFKKVEKNDEAESELSVLQGEILQ